jgi:hypothetical protein
MSIALYHAYNDDRSVPPELLVGFCTSNFSRPWEPTLSWKSIALRYSQERNRGHSYQIVAGG